MMTFHVNPSRPTAEVFISGRISDSGPDAPARPAYRNFRMGAVGGQAALRQNNQIRWTYPVMQPLSSTTTRTVIPPPPRDFHLHRRGNLHPFSLSKEISQNHSRHPFSLGYPERYELNTTPTILIPSTMVLKGRHTFLVENYKLSRPKVNYPTYNILNVKDNLKSQSYPDPMVGAPRPFIHRISELSALEGDTVRREKRSKMKKPRKPPS